MKNFQLTALALSLSFILSGNAIAADLKVGEYDCTIDEVQSYMLKRSEGLRRDTTISTWEDFKGAAKTTNASTAGGQSSTTKADDCSTIFDDGAKLPDIDYGKDDSGLGGIIGSILSGDIGGLAKQAGEKIIDVSTGLIDEMKKGVCKRLSADNIEKDVNGVIKGQTGSSTTSILNGSAVNKAINSEIEESLGRTGKLINVFDSGLDNSRNRAINNEINRQMDSVFK